ncbi:MAG: flagellar hook-basal body complex protein FliE [Planctomycetaceae bacterium]|nr:flagellar hook-basal body complex protein FliE [Planctomycetaceae bacterium]
MTTPIQSLSLPALNWPATQSPAATAAPATSGFQDLLTQSWTDTVQQNADAQQMIETSLVGDDLAMVETFTALREADLSLRLMMQIRNKLVDAYQELQQMRF